MSKSNTCEHCVFFHPNNDNENMQGGCCWRFPPVPVMMQQAGVIGCDSYGVAGMQPPVTPDHSCGEFSRPKRAFGKSRYDELLERIVYKRKKGTGE